MRYLFFGLEKIYILIAIFLMIGILLYILGIYYHALSPEYVSSVKYYSETVGSLFPNVPYTAMNFLRQYFPYILILAIVVIITGVLLYKRED